MMEARRHASSLLVGLPASWRSCDVLLSHFASVCSTQPASALNGGSPGSAPTVLESRSENPRPSHVSNPHQKISQPHLGPDYAAPNINPRHPPSTTPTHKLPQDRIQRPRQQRIPHSNSPAASPAHHLQTHAQQPEFLLQRPPRWGISAPQQVTGRMSGAVSLQDLAENVTRHEHIMNLFNTTAAITRLARLREEYQSLQDQTARSSRSSIRLDSLSPFSTPSMINTASQRTDTAVPAQPPDIRAASQLQFDTDLIKLARRLVDLLMFCLGQDSAAVAEKSGLQSSQLPLISQNLWALSRLCQLYPELKTLAAPLVHLLHKPAFFYSFEQHTSEVLAKSVWAIVKLQMEDHLERVTVRDILAQIATAATTRINETNEFGCTLLVRGLAKQRLKHASLFKAVANRGTDIAETFTPTHLAKTLWAYAIMYPPAPTIAPSLHDALQPQDAVDVLAAITDSKSDPDGSQNSGSSSSNSRTSTRMFDGASSTSRGGLKATELSKGTAGNGREGRGGQGRDGLENAKAVHLVESFERLYQSLADTASIQLPIFKPVDLATLLWACAKLGVQHQKLWERAGGAVLLSLYRFDQQALVDIVWAYSRMGRREEAVLQPLANQAVRRMNKMSAMEVSKLASSFSTLQLFPPNLFSAIRSEASDKLHLMSITDLQYLLPAMRQDPDCDAILMQRLTSQLAVMKLARDTVQAKQELTY